MGRCIYFFDQLIYFVAWGPLLYHSQKKKKSRIRETKHLSTDADSSTNAIGGWTKNTPKPFFFLREKIIPNAKTQKRLEICQNQQYALRSEVSNPSGRVVSRWTKNTQKTDFFEKRKQSSKTQKLKNVQRYAKISDTPFDQRSLIHREAWFPPCFVRQNQQKKLFFARRFQTTSKHKCSNVRPLLSESLKILDIRLREVGAKRPLNGTSKVKK